MAHVRTKWQAVPIIPGDVDQKFRMQAIGVGEDAAGTGRKRRTFGPPTPGDGDCVAEWTSWVETVDPFGWNPGDGVPGDFYVWPDSSTTLCEGDCLEWSLALTGGGGSGTEPNITIEAGEDCVGVIVHVNDLPANLYNWTFVVTATLNGEAFGEGHSHAFGPPPVEDFGYSDSAGVLFTDETGAIPLSYGFGWPGISVVLTLPDVGGYAPELFAWNPSQTGAGFDWTIDTDGSGRPSISIFIIGDEGDMVANGETFTAAPTYDGASANGPITVAPE
ncbi:MAG: hypothetical protein IT519_16725 [Burkholderiales bacterium]|nr:hypothetical protein [Burkholderiales bacterium]